MWIRGAVALIASAAFAAPRFEPARECALCHTRLSDPNDAKRTVGQYPLWLGTMMANSARDPFWRAKVQDEVRLNPSAAAVIEDKCLRCHAPAQQYAHRAAGTSMKLRDLDELGVDGATCSVCHQITAAGLGGKSSFTGGFIIDTEQRIYGPHANPFVMPMIHHVGYTAFESRHILESSLCGTCHTVITPALDADGRTAGEFVEQAPFLEWLAGGYPAQGRTCQSCHLPVLKAGSGEPAAAYIAHRPPGGPFPPTSPRTPFGQHYFVGGNVHGPLVLSGALREHTRELEQTSIRARENLRSAIALDARAGRRAGLVELAVSVRNLTGHKLPTGFPSRRIWLHVTALDSGGRVVFESGARNMVVANAPHYTRIRAPGEVMIYEAEFVDIGRKPTTSLMRAACYSKDNRILPLGFDPAKAWREIAPAGADDDADFVAGSDRIVYELPGATARARVEALYQSVKPSHMLPGMDPRYAQPVSIADAEIRIADSRASGRPPGRPNGRSE